MRSIGLKAKTLLGLSALLAVVIGANLAFMNSLIVADKKAYILENVLLASEQSRKLISDGIESAGLATDSIAVLAGVSPGEARRIFKQQVLVDALVISGAAPGAGFSVSRDDYPQSSDGHVAFVEDWLRTPKTKPLKSFVVTKVPNRNLLEVSTWNGVRQMTFLLSMEPLWNRISNDLVFDHLILQGRDEVLWNTSKDSTEAPDFRTLAAGPALTREVSQNGSSYLVSVAKIPELDISVISYIPAAKAFAVIGDLSLKTVAFGIGLLGVSLLVGLFFSQRLTGPIEALVQGATHISDGNFAHQVVVKTRDELFLLADRFNFMSGKIRDLLGEKEVIIAELRDANAKIEDYSKNLERMVEERTRQLNEANTFIQAMIDSLDQGLFVFDKDLKCSPIFTRACVTLFDRDPTGKDYVQLLDLDEAQTERYKKWAEILFSERIPFESATQLGVLEKTYGDSLDDPNFKVLQFHYHPMRGEDESIQNVVTVATDKTDEVRAIEESRKKERYVEMIFKILASKRQFIDFTAEVENYLRELDELFDAESVNLDQAMLIYHSLNGGFGMYGVDALVTEARECEQTIVDMKKEGLVFKDLLVVQKDGFKAKFTTFKQEIFSTLGFSSNTFEVDAAVILHLQELISGVDRKELQFVFEERIMKVPVEDFLTPYKNLLPALGAKLGKEFAPLRVENGDLRVAPERFKEFFAILVHLFRNCADHGIEAPEVREERGKPIEGQIAVTASLDRERQVLQLSVSDDGGGIDPERVRRKLRERHPEDSGIDEASDQDIIYRIFDQDFSTAEEVTTISGRGVGMSAIKDFVEGLDGRIEITSVVGKGSRFTFELPLSS